jgi:penicillin-binding protein 2
METLASQKKQSWLSWFLRGLILLGFLILLTRLFELQIIKGKVYKNLAENNRIRRIPITAPRGRILARGGEILVNNLEIKKKIVYSPESGFAKSDSILGALDEEIISEWKRDYPMGAKFAHIGGYLGEVSPEEVGKVNPQCPEKGPRKLGSLVGRSGLEQQYECFLSGVDGEELVEVDTSGKKIRILGRKEPVAGTDLKTTIHYGLQNLISDLLKDKKGAIVISDGQGSILSLYSSPSYDPNDFLNGNAGRIESYFKDENLPVFNRAIGGLFHPGSVFKPVVAIAALAEGKIDRNYYYEDTGVIKVGIYEYYNWYLSQYGRTEGKINVVRALARSTDTFFYKIGELVGPVKIADYAEQFGLNTETGIDIPGEISGLVPTPAWKEKIKKESWFLGNTYHLAIGQGDLAVTPVEMNRMTTAVANEGKVCSLHFNQDKNETCRNLKIDRDAFSLVKEGLKEVCQTGGTGYTFFDFADKHNGLEVGCKTGTAETNVDGKTHAWFSAFAPFDFPEIVATVLVERGGEGSKEAGPLARTIFDYWFNQKNQTQDSR